MTDFFDDLERQLVDAAPRRRARLRRARAQRAAAVAGVLAALLAGGGGIAAAVGGGEQDGHGAPAGRSPATTTSHAAATTRLSPPPPGPAPDSYEVAVLNGTTIPGLARGVATRLAAREIRVGQVTNAPVHGRTETAVYYRTPDCIAAANQVAAALDLGADGRRFTLRPITAAQTALIGEGPVVVVVVGSDQNSRPGP